MWLPNVESAEVPRAKLVLYLLNPEHRDGRGKALFLAEFGFTQSNWEDLGNALKQHATVHEVSTMETTAFGVKYAIDGELETPTGDRPNIRVVWFVESDEDAPRLVTAFPIVRQRKME